MKMNQLYKTNVNLLYTKYWQEVVRFSFGSCEAGSCEAGSCEVQFWRFATFEFLQTIHQILL